MTGKFTDFANALIALAVIAALTTIVLKAPTMLAASSTVILGSALAVLQVVKTKGGDS